MHWVRHWRLRGAVWAGLGSASGSSGRSAPVPSEAWFDALSDDVLYRIFRAVVGRPSHFRYKNSIGVSQEAHDDFFGDRRGVLPTQNPGYPMVFVLPRVCRRWREVMKKFPSIWSRASICVKNSVSTAAPLSWWCQHASRLESLYMDGFSIEGLGSLTALNVGILSLLSFQHLRALCLGDCFEEGATKPVLSTLSYLTNLVQLQLYRASLSFVTELSLLTHLSKLKVLELGCAHSQVPYPYTELAASHFPISLEKLALCEALIEMNLTTELFLTNLRCLKLMSSAVSGEFCEHMGKLTRLTKLVVDDSLLEGGADTSGTNSDFLPDDLHKLSNLENVKELSIHGLECGQRGYFEWLGEEVMRLPPFRDLQSLSVCFASLGVMSDSFDRYENLTCLYIAQIRFETIPEPVLRLPNLIRLEMLSCEISSFPEGAPCCANSVASLSLCGNKLRVIPRALALWKNLQTLEFTENPILDFANIECLLWLPNLRTVMLLEGEKSLDLASLDMFSQDFAHMTAALKLGFVCAKLSEKVPSCRVFL